MTTKPTLGKSIYGLQHHADCPIYQAHIEKVQESNIYNAKHYCKCPVLDLFRPKRERIGDD